MPTLLKIPTLLDVWCIQAHGQLQRICATRSIAYNTATLSYSKLIDAMQFESERKVIWKLTDGTTLTIIARPIYDYVDHL